MRNETLARALAPVATALVDAARDEVAQRMTVADRAAADTLKDARQKVERTLAAAREQATADAAAALAVQRAQGRRQARALVLEAYTDAYRELAEAVQAVVAREHDSWQETLTAYARRIFGPGVDVQDVGGGLTASVNGRRIDLGVPPFVAQAISELGEQLELAPGAR